MSPGGRAMPMCSAVLHGRCRPGARADAPQCIGVKTSAWRVRHGREPSRIFSRRGRASNRPVRLRVVLSCRAQKKVACRVWLVRCSLYVGEGGSRVGNWRGVNVAGRGFGTSQFVMGRVSSGPGVCQPLANPQALAAMDRRARAVRGRRHVS